MSDDYDDNDDAPAPPVLTVPMPDDLDRQLAEGSIEQFKYDQLKAARDE